MATPDAPAAPPNRRERYRRQTRSEIKDAARGQIAAAGGAGSLSLNALARSLGMAGPSLYRYFDSRDALLTELLVDAFADLADTVERAVAGARTPVEQFRAYGAAYRRWVLENPELYELLFGTPVPGYAAPLPDTGPAAARALQALITAVGRIRAEAGAPEPPAAALDPADRWADLLAGPPGVDRAAFGFAVRAWTRLHGAMSLEVHGHTPQVVADPAALYAAEVDDLVRALTSAP